MQTMLRLGVKAWFSTSSDQGFIERWRALTFYRILGQFVIMSTTVVDYNCILRALIELIEHSINPCVRPASHSTIDARSVFMHVNLSQKQNAISHPAIACHLLSSLCALAGVYTCMCNKFWYTCFLQQSCEICRVNLYWGTELLYIYIINTCLCML